YVAIVIQTILVLLLAASSSFERLAIMSNLSVLVLYALCCLAAWQLRRRGVQTPEGTPFAMPLGNVLPWLGIALIVWFLTSITFSEWRAFLLVLAIASVLYAIAARRRGAVRVAPLATEERSAS
ncbi:MAG TPA: hypothetical protein VJ717_08410, partial [Gemmatimonadaceae bacterium]|nr:hypothetical protein [Gemmatimonadaceae bacterium]